MEVSKTMLDNEGRVRIKRATVIRRLRRKAGSKEQGLHGSVQDQA